MEYRNLGRTGVRVSPLCVGCLMLGRETSEAESMEIVDRAIDRGINFFDTANMYGRGMSETVLGKAFARNGRRDRVVLATKAHFRMDDDDPNAIGNSRRHMIEQCEKSLRRLQTDHVDLFYVHRPESETPIDETLRALDDLVRAGKVRYIGCSMFTAWQIVESLWAAKEHGLNRFVAEQPPYNLLERRIERELVPCAQTYGIAIMSWSALAAGFLAGRYRRGEAPPPDSRHRGASAQGKPGEILGDASFAVLDVLEGNRGREGLYARSARARLEHGATGNHQHHSGPPQAGVPRGQLPRVGRGGDRGRLRASGRSGAAGRLYRARLSRREPRARSRLGPAPVPLVIAPRRTPHIRPLR